LREEAINMGNLTRQRKQRGVALLVAMFALLLLSAIGMGMMFSANTETNVNANYREKQLAIYAGIAGAMEVKDRLRSGDITVPSDIPYSSAANILYIINPKSGETIAPWDYTNKYYDTELCHDKVMGLTGTYGTQCPAAATSFPSTTTWYSSRDNSSASYTGVFKVTPALDYKWARVQLKTNNSTNFPADGDGSNSGQVCWNGLYQIPRPTGYGVDCIPNGGITALTLISGGTGYTSPATVTISAPPAGGTQATATASVCTGGCPLSGVTITNGGAGYTSAPTVTIAAPTSGTTATATATVVGSGSPITSLTQNNIGPPSCWAGATAPTVNLQFTPGGVAYGSPTGHVNLTPGYNCIAGVSFTGGTCSAPDKNIAVDITASGGSGFLATATIPNSGHLSGLGVSLQNAGTGYTATPTLTIKAHSDGHTTNCASVSATITLGHTMLAAPNGVTLDFGGAGYTTAPTVGFAMAPTFPASPLPSVTANLGTISTGQVVSITLTNPGSGYTSAPAITITGGCAVACTTTATAQATFNGTISSITLTNAGSGYTAPPTVTIGGGGTGATAMATISGGTYFSPVYLITALGYSPAGARAMVQIEAAPAIRALNMPGALTLAGPSPIFGAPNSNNFEINGTDHPNGYVDSHGNLTAPAPAGCATATSPPHPSIGVYDDPNNPTTPSSVTTVLTDIPANRLSTSYPGLNASPDVQNVYGALGEQGTTPSGFDSIVSAVSALSGATIYVGNQTDSTINLGSLSGATPPVMTPAIDVVYGDLTMNGSTNGYGILVVTGTLTFRGNMSWNGIVLAIGQGNIVFAGGGSGTINGSVLVAKTKDTSGNELNVLGTPTLDWSGGGGNGIYYDHCYSDGLLSMIPMNVPAPSKPLTILSIKTLPY
jgi:hypothetical protein